ncbi:MAG: RluA family pseudouridine synthase [Sandaracinaceae bacterium]|nr:RluA family pseudouridine synthase [Sandaracinaceae bacterium]
MKGGAEKAPLAIQPTPITLDSPAAPIVRWNEADCAVVEKPSGMLTQGGPRGVPNLVDWAIDWFRTPHASVINRIDRNVSGLVLIALRPERARQLHRAMQQGLIERHYLAIVKMPRSLEGLPPLIEAPLVKDPLHNLVRVARADEAGAEMAKTKVRLRERFQAPIGWLAEVEASLESGRSHQIRVHLAWAGAPIVGDPKYGLPARGIRRPLLHAWKLVFPHPSGTSLVEVRAPLPWRLEELRSLRSAR